MAKLHSEDLERNINKYIYRLRGGYNIKAMQWHVLGVFSWNSGHLKEKQNHTQLNKLICTWTKKKSLGFMHPQNLTAISLAWAGHATLHSGTGPSRPCQTPCITSTVFFLAVRKQTNCPHSKLQQSSGTTLLEHSYSLYSPSTVSAMLKVASKKGITIPWRVVRWHSWRWGKMKQND